MEAEMGMCFRENRRLMVQPVDYEGILLPKRVVKKEARGAGEAGRRRTSGSRLRVLGGREIRGKSVTSRSGRCEAGRDIEVWI